MTGNQYRHANFVEAAKDAHDLKGKVGIEVARRLIRNQQLGPRDDRARDTNALLLARRQRGGALLFLTQQPDLVERSAHAASGFTWPDSRDDQWQRDVIEYRAVMQQAMILEHHADFATVGRNFSARYLAGVAAIDNHLAAGGALYQGNQLEQGALAGAGMAGHEDHLAAFYVDAEVLQGFVATGVSFADILKTYHGISQSFLLASSASTYSSATNGCMSSAASPIPINLTGIPSCSATDSRMPPRAVPSSLVIVIPVTPSAS